VAKQTVNLGTSANKGDGDPLRTAFTKVNANFTEVYSLLGAEGGDVDDVVAPMLVHNSHTNVTVTRDDAANKIIFSVDPYDGDITGSVFADDSTLLVDGIAGKVMLTTNTTTELTEGTNLYYTDVRADARITNAGSANWNTAFGWGNHASAGYQVAGAPHDGDIEGSVFGDDSTLLVDAVNNKIVGTVDTASLTVSSTNVAIGNSAGLTGQNGFAVAIGTSAGLTNQSTKAVAVGDSAGNITQGEYSVAVGNLAGQTTQGGYSVSVGYLAGATTQGIRATSIGAGAGATNQGADATALGRSSANINQGTQATALGGRAGYNDQGASAVAIGYNAAEGVTFSTTYTSGGEDDLSDDDTEVYTLVVGSTTNLLAGMYVVGTGYTSKQTIKSVVDSTTVVMSNIYDSTPSGALVFHGTQGQGAVAVGAAAGRTTQGEYAVAVGDQAGETHQGKWSVALGFLAGETTQGEESVALGYLAGTTTQGVQSIGIGPYSGMTAQGRLAVAVGAAAGRTNQGENAVAVGHNAGFTGQGAVAIAIGYDAGSNSQAANSIVLNATGILLENTTASSLRIKPIRNLAMTTILGYDAGTGEVTHNAAIPGYTNTADLKVLVAASTDFADYQTRIAAL
jgi:hypothetical protein